MVAYLKTNPEGKYIWVETIFLELWWKRATETQKADFLDLVTKTKQIEIVIGGMVMNDEAITTYGSIIDQLTRGHQFIMDNIGVKPRTGWSIDTFGESNTMASIYKQCGFDYHAIGRIPRDMREKLKKELALQFHWKASGSLDSESCEIFTTILPRDEFIMPAYSARPPYIWEGSWNTNYDKVLNPPVDETTVETFADLFLQEVQEMQARSLNKNVIPFIYGGDFHFQYPERMYGNMSRLMSYINSHQEKYALSVRYATLSEYFDAVTASPEIKWPKRDNEDFYVYTERPNSIWSGYFTSRPLMKLLARSAERKVRICEMVFAISSVVNRAISRDFGKNAFDSLFDLRTKMAQLLHHDAITGTEKPAVIEFYETQFNDAYNAMAPHTEEMLSQLVCASRYAKSGTFLSSSNTLLSVPKIPGENVSIPLLIFNSLASEEGFVARVLSHDATVKVLDSSGAELAIQTKKMNDLSLYEISVAVPRVESVGWTTLFVKSASSLSQKSGRALVKRRLLDDDVDGGRGGGGNSKYSNEFYELEFDGVKLQRITNKKSGISLAVNYAGLLYYISSISPEQPSGAYVFRPEKRGAVEFTFPTSIHITEGAVSTDLEVTYESYASVTWRLYHHHSSNANNFVELDFRIGPIPSGIGREIVFRIDTTSVENEAVVYHDANCLETQRKPLLNISSDPSEVLAANYWPSQCSAFIRDEHTQITFVSQKTQGVTSSQAGRIEAMVHRRTGFDDWKGLFEPLDDASVIEFKMRLLVDAPEESQRVKRREIYKLNFEPEVYFTKPEFWTAEPLELDFKKEYAFVKKLPENVHLLTLSKLRDEDPAVLVRSTHVFEKGEHSELSKQVHLDLKDMFNEEVAVEEVTETSLSAMYDKKVNVTAFTLQPIQTKCLKVVMSNKKK